MSKEHIARFGLSAMGFVYVLVGILTAMTALNWGGQKTGTKGAIAFLSDQPFGKILLATMAIGLFSYAFWRMYQTFYDTRDLGTDFKALFTRGGYFTGGLFYGALGFIAVKLLLGGGYDRQQEVIMNALNSKYGSVFAVIFGSVLAGKAIFEIYFVISNQFKKNVQSSEMPPKAKTTLLKFGSIGHSARAVVFGVMSFLTIRTGLTFRNKKMSTLEDAFQFLNNEFGDVVLGVVALGFLCFGLFMFVKARYLYINIR
ncbi:DUF1206 domain-containing protein [Gelidibacter maritimus]|uniref:DUF1206 domain-containing protein n=1 Tax=Gelidibacter maritimus TaxID=2761487 RepID=A0A7W2M5C8_9FLAO|nr:DUF1206 domain-containing protein [Gelidibacter maritimus]MBA6153007.1 DUF1206 domain-containing protein [Gelidibacter maritimus]